MAMVAAMAMGMRPTSGVVLLTRYKPKCVFTRLALSSSSSSSKPPRRKLILYSKPECCLCDGLKEKLQAAFLLSSHDSLHDVHLEIRDITTNPCWEKEYQYEIPVLAKVLSDGTEDIGAVVGQCIRVVGEQVPIRSPTFPTKETLPRLSPRLGVELVHKKIAEALKETD